MDQYMINRFHHIEELSDEEILKLKEEIQKEIDDYKEKVYDKSTSSEELSEISNSDLPYAEDQMDYINMVIDKRGLSAKAPAMH